MDADPRSSWAPPSPGTAPAVGVPPSPAVDGPAGEGPGRADPAGAALSSGPASSAVGERRRRVEGGRPHQLKVRLTDEELAQLRARAEGAGVSIQRLLVEAALGANRVSGPERRALYVTLLGVRRTLAGAANNLNQLTRWSHAEQRLHPDVDAAAVAVEAAAARLRGRVGRLEDLLDADEDDHRGAAG